AAASAETRGGRFVYRSVGSSKTMAHSIELDTVGADAGTRRYDGETADAATRSSGDALRLSIAEGLLSLAQRGLLDPVRDVNFDRCQPPLPAAAVSEALELTVAHASVESRSGHSEQFHRGAHAHDAQLVVAVNRRFAGCHVMPS